MEKKSMRITREVVDLGLEAYLERLYKNIAGKNTIEDVFGFEDYNLQNIRD